MTSLLRTNPKGTGLQYGETDKHKPVLDTYEFIIKHAANSRGYTAQQLHEDALIEWQSSIVWHEVRKEDEEVFEDLSKTNYLNNGILTHNWYDDIRRGIELPSERVEIFCDYSQGEFTTDKRWSGLKYYPIIKPIKKEEETQEELWFEALKDIQIWFENENDNRSLNELCNDFTQKFKIERK